MILYPSCHEFLLMSSHRFFQQCSLLSLAPLSSFFAELYLQYPAFSLSWSPARCVLCNQWHLLHTSVILSMHQYTKSLWWQGQDLEMEVFIFSRLWSSLKLYSLQPNHFHRRHGIQSIGSFSQLSCSLSVSIFFMIHLRGAAENWSVSVIVVQL